MLKTVIFALMFALLGAILLPLIALFGSLALLHIFDSRCGTPGDSGGCEMGAGMIALGAVIPGLLIGIATGVYFGRTRPQSSPTQNHGVLPRETDAAAIQDDALPASGGLPEAVMDGVRQWAAGASEVKRAWLIGARAGGSYRFDTGVELAIEIFLWDSPDPRDRQHAHSIWFHNRAGWSAALEAVIPHSIQIWPISTDGDDGALPGLPKQGQLVYEREG